jgi:S-adenosylmethionine:tRNA ribosyltransferase-isomerase
MHQNYSSESEKAHNSFLEEGQKVRIADYTYSLPDEKIARFPLENRDSSKLLSFTSKGIKDLVFHNLTDLLQKDDLLVFNRSRVIHARLFFQTAAGAKVEVFCISKTEDTQLESSTNNKNETWYCLVGRASKWKHDEILNLDYGTGYSLSAKITGKQEDMFCIAFQWSGIEHEFIEVLEHTGYIPLPPYLKRFPEKADALRYQTVYAAEAGSVAAPTAGLHFTAELLDSLHQKGIRTAFLTLHVGAGTFRPVKSETLGGHQMHQEEFFIAKESLEQLAEARGRIIAVGTTSLRALESICIAYLLNQDLTAINIGQWDGFNKLVSSVIAPPANIFAEITKKMLKENIDWLHGLTSLLICPPYKIKSAKALITNFHQPESSLLLLVAAAIGDSWKEVYQHALQADYRFLSYGDASYLEI